VQALSPNGSQAPSAGTAKHRLPLAVAGCTLLGIAVIDSVLSAVGRDSERAVYAVVMNGGAAWLVMTANLTAVRLVTWIAALFWTSFAAAALGIALVFPLDMWWALARVDAWPVGLALARGVNWGVGTFAVYYCLRRPSVQALRMQAGRTTALPHFAFVLGIGATLALTAGAYRVLHGERAAAASAHARFQHGEQFRYAVINVRRATHGGWAHVVAWNAEYLLVIPVEWGADGQMRAQPPALIGGPPRGEPDAVVSGIPDYSG